MKYVLAGRERYGVWQEAAVLDYGLLSLMAATVQSLTQFFCLTKQKFICTDIGCGQGSLAKPVIQVLDLFLRQKLILQLSDIQPEAKEIYHRKVKLHYVVPIFKVNDITSSPPFTFQADLLILSDVLHWIPTPRLDDALKNIYELTAPGGIINANACSVFNPMVIGDRKEQNKLTIAKSWATSGEVFSTFSAPKYGFKPISLFSPASLSTLFLRHGLKIIDCKPYRNHAFPNNWHNNMYLEQIAITAQKRC